MKLDIRSLRPALILIVAALLSYFWIGFRWHAEGPLDREQIVEFPRGSHLNDIARQLEASGAVANGWMFLAGLYLDPAGRNLKAGEYAIPAGSSMADIAALLRSGKVLLHRVTLIEGRTVGEALAELAQLEILNGTAAPAPKEGTLRPDTYLVARHTERRVLLERMIAAQEALIQELWRSGPAPAVIHNVQDLLTLASIVEKETGRDDERARVAAVFENRLARHMRLQSDPTVAYGITLGSSELGRDLTRDDLQRPTPWNTYLIDGLPPTPIANPGRKSLEAVLRPAPGDELYFVADGTGGHVFARTLDEHNRNVAKYRQFQNDHGRTDPQ